MNTDKLEELESNIGYIFNDKSLLAEAMSHSSYINERKINKTRCNERLEFLGDAVLEIVSSDYLFKRFKDVPEGKLSKMRAALVCEPALYTCSKCISLGKYVKLGKGEEAGGGREKPSVISDAFEALLGAVYLDGGMEKASDIIHRFILTESQIESAHISDSKSYLQELVQADMKNSIISYQIVSEVGPEHDKAFVVAVYIDGKKYGEGTGRNKKAAEKDAAFKAIQLIRDKAGETEKQ